MFLFILIYIEKDCPGLSAKVVKNLVMVCFIEDFLPVVFNL